MGWIQLVVIGALQLPNQLQASANDARYDVGAPSAVGSGAEAAAFASPPA